MAPDPIKFHTLTLDVSKNICLSLHSQQLHQDILNAELAQSFSAAGSFDVNKSDDELNVSWSGLADLTIQHRQEGENHQYDVTWVSTKPKLKSLVDSYHIGLGHWYGACQVRSNQWPLEKWKRKSQAYVCGDSFKDEYGGVQERYWLSSMGIAIFVDEKVPLFVSMNQSNDRKFTFTAKYDSPYKNHTKEPLTLKYTIVHGINVRTAHAYVMENIFSKPTDIPNEDIFRFPIWSTWAQYKKDINEKVILEFADKIKEHGFKASQLEIDDDWTPTYGDMEFDKSKFPNINGMMQQLKEKGYRVTVWVHPFAAPRSRAARDQDVWVKSTLGGVSTWWNGLGKSLDVTKPGACVWYKGCLTNLRNRYGVDSFKFDAGEVNWLPGGFKTNQEMNSPNTYTTKYAELCAQMDTELRAQEVRVGFRTQHLPMFVRMMDKDSKWDMDNGLQTLIPHALTFGIIGYPFVLPDMIGGNAYKGKPDKELYIRWVQANALLPAIQYSIVPWQYDDEVIEISKKMDALHERYADLIITLAKLSVHTGDPIIRPLWWVAPYDENAQTVDNEFLLGDDILVAPVVQKAARSRAIYLPAGSWKDENTSKIVGGGRWYYDYPAPLDQLPHFTRQERKKLPPRKQPPSDQLPAEPSPEAPADLVEPVDDEAASGPSLPMEGDEDAGFCVPGPPPGSLAEELFQQLQKFWGKREAEEQAVRDQVRE